MSWRNFKKQWRSHAVYQNIQNISSRLIKMHSFSIDKWKMQQVHHNDRIQTCPGVRSQTQPITMTANNSLCPRPTTTVRVRDVTSSRLPIRPRATTRSTYVCPGTKPLTLTRLCSFSLSLRFHSSESVTYITPQMTNCKQQISAALIFNRHFYVMVKWRFSNLKMLGIAQPYTTRKYGNCECIATYGCLTPH